MSSGGLVSFFGAESCSSKLFSFSLSLSRFPGFSSLMSKDRFLQSTSISNLRLSWEEKIVRLSENYFHWKLMYHRFNVKWKQLTFKSCSWWSSASTFMIPMVQGFCGLKIYKTGHQLLKEVMSWYLHNWPTLNTWQQNWERKWHDYYHTP